MYSQLKPGLADVVVRVGLSTVQTQISSTALWYREPKPGESLTHFQLWGLEQVHGL